MQNVIDACENVQAKLIFLDNIYMYASPLPMPFDENASQNPDLMMKGLEDKKIKGLIGRSADFYGEGAVNSLFCISFLERILRGKGPQTLISTEIEHTYANVLDNGRDQGRLIKLRFNPHFIGVRILPNFEALNQRIME